MRFHRGWIGLLAMAAALCLAATAAAERILLPGGAGSLEIPEDMRETPVGPEEGSLKADYVMPPDLEMFIFQYDAEGNAPRSLAEALIGAGKEAEVRRIGETEFLIYEDRDETDGAPCVGYTLLSGGKMTEISFFYGSESAGEKTRIIMESFQP